MDTNPAVAIEESKEMVLEEITEIDMEMVPERYIDTISGEFAYDPVRLPLDQDPTQLLYNRKTLQTIWEIEQHARNPLTRQWFDIKSAIPQTELRKEMKHFVELHRFPAKTVITEYSKILDEEEMERHLMKLGNYVQERPITEDQWAKVWKKINLLRLFCEFHHQNIKLFISLHGFIYLSKVIGKTITEKDVKETALDVGKEIVRAIDVILNGLRAHGENSMGVLGNQFEKDYPGRQLVILSLIAIVRHVYNNNEGYLKIQSLVLRAFSTIFHEIDVDTNILLRGNAVSVMMVGFPCALKILSETNVKDISSEDFNHAIAILGTERVPPLAVNRKYATALGNAVIICISREIERSNQMNGFREGQLLESEMQARHNSEAVERGVRLIRDIAMDEGPLTTRILTGSLDIVKNIIHMFERFTHSEKEDVDGVGNRTFPVLICGNNCEMVQCVHYRIAGDGLEISEAISRKGGPSLDVDILRKFIGDRTGDDASPSC